MKKADVLGKRFGRLLVKQLLPNIVGGGIEKRSRRAALCECDCGTICTIKVGNLMMGTKSCGCIQRESIAAVNYKHGEANKTKENKAWQHIISRCNCPTNRKYPDYGGRGIKVCDRWLNSYEDFLSDMGRCPDPKMSIDRIDVNGDYEPNNCRWATSKEQSNNTRANVFIEYNGERLTLKQCADKFLINYKHFHGLFRYKKLSINQIVQQYGRLPKCA